MLCTLAATAATLIAYLLVYLYFGNWSGQIIINFVVPDFFKFVAEQKYEEATRLCTGEEKYILSSNAKKENIPGAKIIDVSIEEINVSGKLAEALCTVESQVGTEIDVQRYSVRLIKGTDWKIYSLTKVPIQPKGVMWKSDTTERLIVFEGYLNAVKENSGITDYLVGTAKSSYILTAPQLGKTPLIKEFSNVTGIQVSGSKKVVADRIDYVVDGGRPVSLVVTFYKFQDGWKIAEIRQV